MKNYFNHVEYIKNQNKITSIYQGPFGNFLLYQFSFSPKAFGWDKWFVDQTWPTCQNRKKVGPTNIHTLLLQFRWFLIFCHYWTLQFLEISEIIYILYMLPFFYRHVYASPKESTVSMPCKTSKEFLKK